MKQLIPSIEVTETFTCDWCGKVMLHFASHECFGCGKHTCNEACWYTHLKEYKGGWPAKLEESHRYSQHGTGIHVPNLFFCHECDKSNEIAKLMREIEEEQTVLKCAFDKYRNIHYEISKKIERMVAKQEAKRSKQ